MTLAEFIRDRMDELGLSQADLWRLTGVSQAACSRWMSGRGVPKSEKYLPILAAALQCDLQQIRALWYPHRPQAWRDTETEDHIAETVARRAETNKRRGGTVRHPRVPGGNDTQPANEYRRRIEQTPFTRFIRARKLELGLTGDVLASLTGANKATISGWFNGSHVPMSEDALIALAKALKCSPSDLSELWLPARHHRRFYDYHEEENWPPLARFIRRRMWELNLDNDAVVIAAGLRHTATFHAWKTGAKFPLRKQVTGLAKALQVDRDELDKLWLESRPKHQMRRSQRFCEKHNTPFVMVAPPTDRNLAGLWVCPECKRNRSREIAAARYQPSKFIGVYKITLNTWVARVQKNRAIGTYSSELEAARARDIEVIRLGLHLPQPGYRDQAGTHRRKLTLNFPELVR